MKNFFKMFFSSTFAISILFGVSQLSLVNAADSELVVFDWGGYEDPGFFQDYIEHPSKDKK